MPREIENKYKETEIQVGPKVGLRLQDVIMRSDTSNPNIIALREMVGIHANPSIPSSERVVVLDALSRGILGMDLGKALEKAGEILVPYHSNGEQRRTLVISSASSASASQETECAILKTRGHVIDIPGAIEGRDTRSASDRDTALISTKAGLLMAKARGNVEIINLADETVVDSNSNSALRGSDIYYKADGLLLLALTNPNSRIVTQLVETMKENPLIYPYNLDEETQLALLWLAKQAGLDRVDVNANSPEVGVELTRKGYRYPTVEDAIRIPDYDDPYKMQLEEWKLSQAAREIGYHPDCVPGYVINRTEEYGEFYTRVTSALSLLNRRYSLDVAWVKPDRGTDGGNQGPVGTSTNDSQEIDGRIQEMWRQGGNWVIEAKTKYFKLKLPLDGIERTLSTTPSVHVIKGEPRFTISLQLVDGVAWGGNLICSQGTWNHLVDMVDRTDERIAQNPGLVDQLKSVYELMPRAMHDYVDAINGSSKYRGGQVRGGADLAVATLGGKFGDDSIVVAVQDYNARANGCETAYALYDQAQDMYGKKGEAITRNITPKVDFNAFALKLTEVIEAVNIDYDTRITSDQVKLIAVSAGWGQIGMIGTDAIQITRAILLLELQMRKSGLIQ